MPTLENRSTEQRPTAKELRRALAPCYGCQNEKGGCQEGCPTGLPLDQIRRLVVNNGIPGLDAATALATEHNPLGLLCVDACDPCQAEEGCRNRYPVPMRDLHRLVAEHLRNHMNDFHIDHPKPNGKKVAIIGDGPAAMTAAIKLAASGTRVTIFSKNKDLGGLAKDIPRVDPDNLHSTTGLLREFGNLIEVNYETTASPTDDYSEYNGIIVATGLEYKVPKEFESPHAKHAVDFIRENREAEKDSLKGRKVLIVGGGKTAVDAAIRAKELGATDVEVIYRRDLGSMDEYQELVKAGIRIRPQLWPEEAGKSLENEDYVRFTQTEPDETQTEAGGTSVHKRSIKKTGITETHRANLVLWATPGIVMDEATTKQWAGKEIPVSFAGDVLELGKKTVANAVNSGMKAAGEVLKRLNVEKQPIIRRPVVNTSAEFIKGQPTKTPFMVAAVPTSDASNIEACRAALSQEGCSGIVVKTTSFDDVPIEFPDHYMVTTESGGLPNGMGNADHISRSGITKALETATRLKEEFPGKKIVVSIMSPRLRDWGVLAKRIQDAGLDGVECSFSCPQGNLEEEETGEESDNAKFMKELGIENVKGYGSMLGQNIAQSRAATISMLRAVGPNFPISIKIPTSNTPFIEMVEQLYAEGIRYFTCANSILGAAETDLGGIGEPFAPGEAGEFATVGYTGSGITTASLASVLALAELKEKCPDLKIWGTGGMMSGKDAIAMLAAGADGVQFGTALIERGVDIFEEALLVLQYYCYRYGKSVMDIVNSASGRVKFGELVAAKKSRNEAGIRLVATHDPNTCVDCGNCATTCNEGMHGAVVIDPASQEPTTDEKKCEGCGACAGLCPTGAITMEEKRT